ncbi:hypothetical protein ZIOFF_025567 [Zingiber officinale]|uniref:DCL protein n=1 Tax=Zingiber officinale TaxID=94328 RepID=A0A8J5GUA4_ZINOF|nr:hypothetical protein ZIOFF_025567 [Zingiber officinale]
MHRRTGNRLLLSPYGLATGLVGSNMFHLQTRSTKQRIAHCSLLTFPSSVRSHHALIVENGLLRPGAPSPTGRPSAARGFSLPPPPLRLGDPRGGGTPIPACSCIGRRGRAGLVLWRPQGHTSLEAPTWNSVEPASRLQAVEGCGRGDPEGHRTHKDAHQAHSPLRQSVSVELQLEANEIIGSKLMACRYFDGERLSAKDEKEVIGKLLRYHPRSEDKIGCGLDYIMVDRHPQFKHSRCLFVVRTDGGWIDFSYQKCLRAYIRDKYPLHAERFIGEHLKRN